MSAPLRQRLFVGVLVAPAFLVLFGVVIYPFFYNVILSLSNMNLRHMHDWRIIGFDQYVKVFSASGQSGFYGVFLKTVIWTVVNLFFHVVIGVFLALVLNQKEIRGKALFRAILILPWAVPQLIVALTWRGMFNYEYGTINLMLNQWFGLPGVQWLRQPLEAFLAVIITNVWLGFPFMMVIALGALQSIPHDLYEAADIDGASWYHKLKNITIPLIRPVLVPAVTLGTIWTFNNLNIVWLVTNAGEPSDKSHLLVSFVYKAAFNFYRYGYGAALSMVIFFILLAFSLAFMRRTKVTENVYS